MSILQVDPAIQSEFKTLNAAGKAIPYPVSAYTPTADEMKALTMIKNDFVLGDVTMQKPRVEFNDLSVLGRQQVDQIMFNTYIPNNGEPLEGDETNAWRSNAMRPVARNKVMSIAAHATARLIFPKVFAYDSSNDEQRDAAQVMSDLIEWASDQSDYSHYSLMRTLSALTDPASIGYTEYCETYRTVKREKEEGGAWKKEDMLDESLSGFQDTVVPVNELYIENFYEPDVQKQGWLLWRRVISYSLAKAKYEKKYKNFEYVSPGVQLIYNDANQTFYQVYDTNMRQYDVEEVIYWNKGLDVKLIEVNGCLLTDCENPNPRIDKQYPFDKFGYSVINSKCFYYKSLIFHMMHDVNIINTLYPMIVDGTYLNIMPAMVQVGGETLGGDVIVPGAVSTLSSPDADLRAIQSTTPQGLVAGMNTLQQVEESNDESSQDPIQQGQDASGQKTAYEISRLEQNAATVLGLFIKMISQHVKDFGRLRIGDILQYLTIAEADQVVGNEKLLYKTFILHDKQSSGRSKTRKIIFDSSLPDEPQTKEQRLQLSYDTLEKQDKGNDVELYRANPELFRNLKYMATVSPDVLNPMSEDLERAYSLEEYDRAIANPMLDQEQVTRDFLLGAYPKSRKDPDKYFAKQQAMPLDPGQQAQQAAMQAMGGGMPGGMGGGIPGAQQQGAASAIGKGLPTVPTTGKLG